MIALNLGCIVKCCEWHDCIEERVNLVSHDMARRKRMNGASLWELDSYLKLLSHTVC